MSDIAMQVRVQGTVQGVGFRPHIARLAHEHGMRGNVINDSLGVLCTVIGAPARVRSFIDDIRPRAPRLAVVEHVSSAPLPMPACAPDGFSIEASRSLPLRRAHLPVDTHACSDCLREMRDPADRRFNYPFVNCTNCGPRYSIVRDLPYDRPATSMAAFPMCEACRVEYEDVSDRRYHAQPIACHDCGPRLTLVDLVTGESRHDTEALATAAQRLERGEIIALKSVGGFHLVVNAQSEQAVAQLRQRKRRDHKPFAVMTRNLPVALRIAALTRAECAMLETPQRPILLARKADGSRELADNVAPDNPSVGVMLPSAPHHELLFDHLDLDLLVMTSGNLSGHPIEIDNTGARARLGTIASCVLEHDRDIVNRLDDSVVRLTDPGDSEAFFTFIRRGRGYAPYYLSSPHPAAGSAVLGAGSELKATAAVSDGESIYASQHVGDVTNETTAQAHRAASGRLTSLYAITPTAVVSDLHPAFLERTRHLYGQAEGVQHHHAHLASCLLDHGLPEGTYLGVVLDGVGYGADGTMWGAEFLVGGYSDVTRVSSLRTVTLIGGDAAVRQPARIALALARASGALQGLSDEDVALLLGLTSDEVRVFDRMLERGINTAQVSSMGRLFDGVAALVGYARRAEYEAQGPIELEGLLQRDFATDECYRTLRSTLENPSGAEDLAGDGPARLDWAPLVRDVVADVLARRPAAEISRRFHTSVAVSVAAEAARVAREHDISHVALSGGVWLNEFLTVHVPRLLVQQGLTPLRHLRVPTNDGGIALGQVAVHQGRQAAAL